MGADPLLANPIHDFEPPLLNNLPKTITTRWTAYFGPVHSYTKDLPFMQPPLALLLPTLYLFTIIFGTAFLRHFRLKFRVKPLMRLYNLFMVILSAYMAVQSLYLTFYSSSNTNIWCVPMSSGQIGPKMAQLVWLFTFSKVIEFLDTFFMLLENRWRQISFLHVYHHMTIFLYWFSITWKAPGSDAYFSLAGNSFIHVLMYGYYFLASVGYSPWWKYYITYCQIAQFVLFAMQSVYVGYIMTEVRCDFPNVLSRGLLWYMISLIVLFSHFLVTNKRKKNLKVNEKKMQ